MRTAVAWSRAGAVAGDRIDAAGRLLRHRLLPRRSGRTDDDRDRQGLAQASAGVPGVAASVVAYHPLGNEKPVVPAHAGARVAPARGGPALKVFRGCVPSPAKPPRPAAPLGPVDRDPAFRASPPRPWCA